MGLGGCLYFLLVKENFDDWFRVAKAWVGDTGCAFFYF